MNTLDAYLQKFMSQFQFCQYEISKGYLFLIYKFFCQKLSGFLNYSVRVYPIKLKIDMLYDMNNTFRSTIFQISVNVSLTKGSFNKMICYLLKFSHEDIPAYRTSCSEVLQKIAVSYEFRKFTEKRHGLVPFSFLQKKTCLYRRSHSENNCFKKIQKSGVKSICSNPLLVKSIFQPVSSILILIYHGLLQEKSFYHKFSDFFRAVIFPNSRFDKNTFS